MGLSEKQIAEAVWVADQLNKNVLYTFPTQSHLQDFVQARVDPVLMRSDYLNQRTEGQEDPVLKIGLKKVGNAFLYFRGSQNEKQIITIDADMVVLDERDRFVQENVPFIDKRLLASKLQWRREISTPTLPETGIHAAYLESDQRIWEIPCKKCGEYQELDFFNNVDFEKKLIRCLKCKKPMPRLIDGRWRALNPSSQIHGYKINGLYNPSRTVPQLIAEYKQAKLSGFSALQQFYNQVLGLPYEVQGQSLSVSDLNACKKPYNIPVKDIGECYAGVDVGVEFKHVVVLQKLPEEMYRVVWAGTVSNFLGPYDSLEAIIKHYKVKLMVVDKKPETTKVKEVMDAFPGRVFACTYPTMNFSVQQYFEWDDIKYELKLDRTISLDYLIGDIQNKRVELPENIETIQEFYDHLRSSTRITEKNPRTGVETGRWIEKGPDHYFHAFNYARMAQSRGQVGKALLDYYSKPFEVSGPGFIDWVRVNGKRLF